MRGKFKFPTLILFIKSRKKKSKRLSKNLWERESCIEKLGCFCATLLFAWITNRGWKKKKNYFSISRSFFIKQASIIISPKHEILRVYQLLETCLKFGLRMLLTSTQKVKKASVHLRMMLEPANLQKRRKWNFEISTTIYSFESQ